MAGLTPEGLVIKRLNQVIEDRIASARRYFGNSAKVSVNDVLGRTLRVSAESEADLWELLELEYNSLHPDFAQDTSLDRVVSYGRLTREEAQPSTTSVLMTADYGTIVPAESYITSSSTNNRFMTSTDTVFGRSNISGFVIEVLSADGAGQDYAFTVDNEEYRVTSTGATVEEVASYLINSGLPPALSGLATVEAVENYPEQVQVTFNDIFVPRTIQITTPNTLTIRKISKMAPAHSEEQGPVAQPAETLDSIGTPVTGWDSVINPQDAALGNFRETDEELRLRFRETKEVNATGTISAIKSNVLSLIGVKSVEVYENERSETDLNGIPPHSFSVIALGGNTVEIAETIWAKKPAGIRAFGNTAVEIVDSQGYSQTVAFSRPIEVPIYITLDISPIEDEQIPTNVDRDIISELQNYFSEHYTVGDDVVYSRLYTPINRSFDGFQVDSLTLGTGPDPVGTSNVAIAYDQIATLPRENVTVNITY